MCSVVFLSHGVRAHVCACMRACVCVRARACVRACVCACVRVCVCVLGVGGSSVM